jgi:hypothetical protein
VYAEGKNQNFNTSLVWREIIEFSLPEVLGLDGPNGKNATFIAAEFTGIREVTRQGVSVIPYVQP